VLSGTESSTLAEEALRAIRAAVRDRVALYSKKGYPCAFQVIGDSNPETGSGWHSLPDKLRAGELVFRGEVAELTPGWDVPFSQASTLVGVRVEEVFGDREGPEPGSLVVYIQPFGSIQAQGVTACTTKSPSDFEAHVGDQLLVSANGFDSANESLLVASSRGDIYPIHDGMAVERDPKPTSAAGEISIDSLRTLKPRGESSK